MCLIYNAQISQKPLSSYPTCSDKLLKRRLEKEKQQQQQLNHYWHEYGLKGTLSRC